MSTIELPLDKIRLDGGTQSRAHRVKGKFMLSINDTPEIREIFDGFETREVALTYSVGAREGEKRKKVGELVVMNYRP
jgi:DNA adenine methylase